MADLLEAESPGPMSTGVVQGKSVPAQVAWSKRDYESTCVAWNERRDVCLVFIGDDFDLDAKAAMLRQRGIQSRSDIECLLHLYEEFGLAFISSLNGRFSGVVLDRRTDTLHLFNDRYGLNRIYVHESKSGLYFSSEAKSLLAVLPNTRSINQRSLAEFFAVGCVMQNRSLFEGIALLPPASVWTIQRDGVIQKETYFSPKSWEEQEPLGAAEYGQRLAEIFSRAAPRYLRGTARVGMSLTGGLDSRMILAWIRSAPGSLPCYTFGGPYRDCADVRIARELARVCQQEHTTLRIGSDFFSDFLNLAEKSVYRTDGTMDVSGAVELYMNRRARQIAPIRLTGNYGSEILRSNIAFRPSRLDCSFFTPEFCELLDQAAGTYRHEASCDRLSFIAFKQVPWHHYGRFAAERSELTPRSPFLDNELVALAYRAPRELLYSPQPLLELITQGNSALDTVGTDRALSSHATPVWGTVKRQWREFTAKAEYAYDYGMPPWLTRTDALLKPLHLERLFLGRHKFYHFRVWYRDQLSTALKAGDFTRSLSCYCEGAPKRIIEQHTSGKFNRTLELHKLLTVQLIERALIRSPCLN